MIVRHRLQAVIGIAVAACAAVLLLSACGGGAAEPGSTHSETAKRFGTAETPPDTGTTERQESSKEDGRERTHKVRKPSPIRAGRPANPEHHGSADESHSKPEGCPSQLSRQQCAQLAEAGEPTRDAANHGTQPTECPQALSKAECQELTEIHKQNAEGGPPPTEECPPGLTAGQCRELESAYEEANR